MHTNHRRISPSCAVICFVLLIACGSIAAFAQTPNSVADALNQGVAAFKAGRYTDAIEGFKKALVLDPNYTMAKLYLGTTYAYQVVPNLKTPENLAAAENAIATFKQIPDDDPGYHEALKQLASVYRNIGRLDEARDTELAALKLVPDDAETHYTVSVIDWTQAYKFSVDALLSDGLQDDGLGNAHMSPATCEKIKTHNAQLVDDAIAHLTRAIELNPNHSDAMVYLNLVYRRRADFDCKDPSARAQDVALADKWSKQAAQIREKASSAAAPQ